MAPRAPYQSLRMFKHPLLEQFSHVDPKTPLLLWLPVVLFLIGRTAVSQDLSLQQWLAFACSGLLVWSFMEYVLHRWVFHFVGNRPWTRRLHFIIHGVHHDDPQDPTRLLMPPAAAAILAMLLWLLFRRFLSAEAMDPFFAFFLVGYLAYDYIHFAVHHFTPRTRVGRYLKWSHMRHHFVDSNARWGVSSPLWDVVFGTLGVDHPKAAAVKSVKP